MKKILSLITLILITSTNIQFSSSQNSSIDHEQLINEIKTTFELLEEGQQNIILSQQRDVALILGNTGSGKSTIIQWLFGDNDKLISVQSADKSFRIEDGNVKIGNSTIESKTLFPELVIDNSTDNAYYDCPGFKDTRQTSHDLAITYFIKRVADHAHKVKLVFVINHSSLRIGVDRQDFKDLLEHATEFIKDIDKFSDSICAMATKVENSASEDDEGNLVLVSDEDIISGIGEFLTEVRNDLKNDAAKVQAVKLINVFLLRNNDGSYARIGIFRRPEKAGPLSKIPSFQEGKKHVLNILNSLTFTSKNDQDFGYTVSDRSKGDISYIVQEIGLSVGLNLDRIGHSLLDKFHASVKNVNKKLNDFSIQDDDVDSDTINEEIERTNNFLNSGIRELSRLIGEINGMKSPSELTKIIRSSLSTFKLDLGVNQEINIISKQGEFFDFLQLVSKKTFSLPKSWALNLESKAQNISILNAEFQNSTNAIVEKIATQVDGLFSTLGRTIYDHHKNIVELMKNKISLDLNGSNVNVLPSQVTAMKADVNTAIAAMAKLVANIKSVQDLTALYKNVIASVGKISIDEKLTLKLRNFLYFLSNKNDDKMRQSWSILFRNEVMKISSLNEEFEKFVNSVVELVKKNLNRDIEASMKIITDYYRNLAQNMTKEIESFVDGSLFTSDPIQVQKQSYELSEAQWSMSKLSTQAVRITNPVELAENIKLHSALILNIDSLNELTAKIEHYFKLMNFLVEVNNQVFTMSVDWIKLFKNAADTLTELRRECDRTTSDLINSLKNSINTFIDEIDVLITKYYEKQIENVEAKIKVLMSGSAKVEPLEAQTFRDTLAKGYNTLSALTDKIKTITDVTTLADTIGQSARGMKLELSAARVKTTARKCVLLNYVLIVSNTTVNSSWFNKLELTRQNYFKIRKAFENNAEKTKLEVENRIENLLMKFSQSLTNFFNAGLKEGQAEVEYLTLDSGSVYRTVNVSRANALASHLNNTLMIMSSVSVGIKSISRPIALSDILQRAISKISGIRFEDNLVERVTLQIEILNFILVATNVQFETPPSWLSRIINPRDSCAKSFHSFTELVTDRTQLTLYSLLISELETSTEKIFEHYDREMAEEKNPNTLLVRLRNGRNVVGDLLSQIKNEGDLFAYFRNIQARLSKLDMDKNLLKQTLKRYEYWEYMQALSAHQLIRVKSFTNKEPFKEAKFLRDAHTWYTFLLNVDEKLSAYEIQSQVSRYNLANLDHWGQYESEPGISIHSNNFHAFLEKLKFTGEIENVELTRWRLKTLDIIVSANLKNRLEPACDRNNDKVIFRGYCLKFSDFVYGEGLFRNPCNFNLRNIEISAAKTLFVDGSFIAMGSEFKVRVTAPKWEVIGQSRQINLNGLDGQSHSPLRASEGSSAGGRGQDGKAGLPGGPAGSFVGTGAIFINGDRLSISVNGGKGGRGQDGGHGKGGSDGDFVELVSVLEQSAPAQTMTRFAEKVERLGYSFECNAGSFSCTSSAVCRGDSLKIKPGPCIVRGKKGESGGDGGAGGKAGIGGKQGTVEIIERGDKSGISLSRNPGSVGQSGQGGEGGKGGEWQIVSFNYARVGVGFFYVKMVELIKEAAANGARGISY